MARVDWSTAAQGARVVPILLIHGVPVVIVPEGVTLTGCSLSSPDSAWWPGNTFADWSGYVKAWLSLGGDGVTISERATPATSQLLEVSEVTLRLSDVDLAVTALFANEDSANATYITAEVSASAATVNVVSTANFAASGTFYLDQEAIAYSGKTATSFTGCTRGQYGSKATRHLYSASQGSGLGNPQCTDIVVEVVGLPATLWLGQVSSAGVLTAVQLEHFGIIGGGPVLAGGGEDQSDGWVISVDHAIKRMGQTIRAAAVSVGGYAHPGNLSARTTGISPSADDLTPFYLRMAASAAVASNVMVLTGDAAAPDLGGWHPTREAYVDALNFAGVSFGAGTFSASLRSGNRLHVSFTSAPSTSRYYYARAACCAAYDIASEVSATSFVYDFGEMAEAWVPIMAGSPVYLSASDYAAVPAAPAATNAAFVLIFGDDNDRSSRRVARITGQGTSGVASFVTCTALTTAATVRGASTGTSGSGSPSGPTLWRGGYYGAGFIITEPTTARLGFYVSSSSWVSALQTFVQSLDVEYASVADAIDFTRMQAIADAYPSPIDTRREYVFDLNTTLLSVLQNEAALNGFALTMYRGRVSITRVAEFAVTETTQATITSSDLDAAAPVPTVEKASDGLVNTFTVVSPDDGVTVNVVDRTSHARYGGQGTITCTMPRSILGAPRDASRLYAQVFAQAVQVLGPLRYPVKTTTVQLPLNKYDLQVGDLATLTLWRVPNGSGGRGITGAVAQVTARTVKLYGDDNGGHVTYTFRLNPNNLSGYAPAMLVAAGGIAGAVVTQDTSTISGGLSGTSGDAGTFAVGDLVRLVEIDSTSPTAATDHTVAAVGATTITLNPAPSGTFAALAASALKVVVRYQDWTAVIAGANAATQGKYAFLADTSYELDSTHPARVYAA